jgi:carotenoid cleavage dioxygenase-like enzyme
MHSFSATPHWIVLIEGPFTVRATSFRFKHRPELSDYTWDASKGTRILLVNRTTGELVRVLNTRALFALHHIGAWEDRDAVFVDLAAFADPAILRSLSLDRDGMPRGPFPAPQPTRLAIDIVHGVVTCTPLKCPAGAFSAIDPRTSMSRHTVLYNVVPRKAGEPCMILCQSTSGPGERMVWYSDNCYPGAPVFVPASSTSPEGTGWLLDVVLDAAAGRSFLLVLDAATMTELARAWLPCSLPFGSHTLFVPEEATP